MERETIDFQRDVIEASYTTPIVVDFWAEWCGPCRMLGPVLESLSERARGRWRLVKVNVDAHPDVARAFNVRSIPMVMLFHEGKPVAEFMGALPEAQVVQWLDAYVPTEAAKALNEAKRLSERGDAAGAWSLLEEVVRKDPSNEEARVLLAELLFESDPDGAAKLVQDIPVEHPLGDRANTLRTLLRLMRSEEELTAIAAKSPDEAEDWAKYLKGIEALKQRRYADALRAWIEVIRRNRELDDDGARKACVALFLWLGNEHEITQEYRPPFSSALYS